MIISELKKEKDLLLVEMYEIVTVVLQSHKRMQVDEKKAFINHWLESIELQKTK
jgi:hypothetical protein